MGYLRGLMHGALAGAVLGVLYAPESGAVTRRRVCRWLGQAEDMPEAAVSFNSDREPGKAPIGGRGWNRPLRRRWTG